MNDHEAETKPACDQSVSTAGLGGCIDVAFARSLAHAYWHGEKDDRQIAMVLHDALDEILRLRPQIHTNKELDEICNTGMQSAGTQG